MKTILLITTLLLLHAEALTLTGSVLSDNQKIITSRFMGFVTEVNVNEGDKVKRGSPLYSIDSKEIDATKTQVELAISQAELSLQMYQNQYANAKLNLERHQRLLRKDMVSKFEVENLALGVKNLADMIEISKRQVIQAKARLNEVTNQYKYLKIVAPNDGIIIQKNIKVGEMAMPGMPAIVLSDLKDLVISVEVSESDLQSVPYGKRVNVEIPSIGFNGIGKIKAIIPNSNPMTHTFKIKVSFKNPNGRAFPGMYAKVNVQ